jgi:hypothetical protein
MPSDWIQRRAVQQNLRNAELQRLQEAAPSFLKNVAGALTADMEYYSAHIQGEHPQLTLDMKRLSGQLSLATMAAYFEYDVAGGKLNYHFQPAVAPSGTIEGITIAADGVTIIPPNDSYDLICEKILGPVLFPDE